MAGGVGAYGKMPSLGDFFRIALPPGFVTPWDDWLAQGLAECKATPDWDNLYLSAPIWRFTLSAGLAGPDPVCGVMMASVDRVGRRFPLTLAQAGLAGSVGALHFGNEAGHKALENVALEVLSEELSKAELQQRLDGISLRDASHHTQKSQPGQAVFTAETQLNASLAGEVATRHLHAPSLWSCETDGTTRCLACDGLPDMAQFKALFDISAPLWMTEIQGEYV